MDVFSWPSSSKYVQTQAEFGVSALPEAEVGMVHIDETRATDGLVCGPAVIMSVEGGLANQCGRLGG